MSRPQAWTQKYVCITERDSDRLYVLTGGRYPSEYIREALNDWLEKQGQPPLEESASQTGRPGRPRKVPA